MATHSDILAWKIPWTEEPGRVQCTRSQRAGHDGGTKTIDPIHHSKKSMTGIMQLQVWRKQEEPCPGPGQTSGTACLKAFDSC